MTDGLHLLPEHEDSVWDEIVRKASDRNVFQSAGWGNYKRAAGWIPMRWVGRDDARTALAAQLLVRRLPLGLMVAWSPGGPLLGFGDLAPGELSSWLSLLLRRVSQMARAVYLRLDCHSPAAVGTAKDVAAVAERPRVRLNTGITTVLDLRKPPDALIAGMRPEHRRHLKRAASAGLRWVTGRDDTLLESLVKLHDEMLDVKRLRARHHLDRGELGRLVSALPTARVTVGYRGSEAATAGLLLEFGGRAVLQTPATGQLGRELSASYGLVLGVADLLRSEGIKELDLAGLSGRVRSAGVDQYKRGFGGSIVERLGEWEWASTRPMKWIVNLAVATRGPELVRRDERSRSRTPRGRVN